MIPEEHHPSMIASIESVFLNLNAKILTSSYSILQVYSLED
jgi:hypothetical protein